MRTWSLAPLALLLTGCGSDASNEAPARLDLTTGQPLRAVTLAAPSLGPLPAPPTGTGDGYRTDFVRAFTHGLVIEGEEERIHVAVRELGALTVQEAGPLLASDPVGPDRPVDLPVKLPPEAYPVQVSRVRIEPRDGGAPVDQVAAARILLGRGAPTAWHWIGQYTTDSGLGAFLSPTAAEALQARRDALTQRIVQALEADPAGAALLATRPAAPTDLAFFPAGPGEGSVEVYVGVDDQGRPVEVVADFLVLVEPDEVVAEVRNPTIWPPGLLPAPELEELGIELRRAHADETIPTTGAPCWVAIDARSIARDPRIGFPRVECRDGDGRVLPLEPVTEGYRLWLPPPPDGLDVASLAVVLQMGVKAL